jgi:protein NrfD
MPPSDTFFTTAPHWSWLVVLSFFLGGISGGSYFLAALIDLLGGERDRPLARLGYYVAFPTVLVCGLLLIADLTRPESFWHMLIQSERVPLPVFKYWSPMSIGSWALLIFGGFTFLSFFGSLAEEGRLRWGPAVRLDKLVRRGPIGAIFALLGSAFGFFLASYTGVLVEVTNRPIWADNSLLGLLFLMSAASTAAALLILLARSRSAASAPTIGWLVQMDRWAMLLELVVLAAVLISLGPVAQALLNVWGALLLAVVVLGILVPLALAMRRHAGGGLSLSLATILVLAGGLILRAVIVFASEAS